MNTNNLKTASLAAAAATIASVAPAAEQPSVDELIANLKSADDKVRGPAWQGAAPYGAPAVQPLAATMTDDNFQVARAAKRALWKIVRHAGRPGAAAEAKAVETALLPLLGKAPSSVKREVLWMLSEIGGNAALEPMAGLLTDREVRDDARCTLQRMPGDASLATLKQAFAVAPEDFKYNLADSLRARGEKVAGYPSKKLVPTKQTTVKQPTM